MLMPAITTVLVLALVAGAVMTAACSREKDQTEKSATASQNEDPSSGGEASPEAVENDNAGDGARTAARVRSLDLENAPKISFPETSYNFGTIAQGVTVTHAFEGYNAGKAPLELINAKGS